MTVSQHSSKSLWDVFFPDVTSNIAEGDGGNDDASGKIALIASLSSLILLILIVTAVLFFRWRWKSKAERSEPDYEIETEFREEKGDSTDIDDGGSPNNDIFQDFSLLDVGFQTAEGLFPDSADELFSEY
jgi:hypothetical protein